MGQWIDFKELRARVSLEDVIFRYYKVETLKRDGLKLETCQLFGVGWCARGIMRGCIAIPIHDEDGDLVAYAGRRLKPSEIREYGKYKFPKGLKKERILYNLHRAKAHQAKQGLIL